MLKTLLTTAAIAAATLTVQAEDFTVSNVILPQNGTVAIEISMNNPTMEIGGFIFYMQLPEGLQPVFDTEGYPAFEKGERIATKEPQSGYVSETRKASYALLAGSSAISGTSGVLILPIIQLDGDVAVGTEFQVTLSNIQLTTTIPTKEDLDDVTFTVTVGEPDDGRIHFNEAATKLPTYTAGEKGDVSMVRSIKADTWSTIVLPFTLTKAKAETIFGSDVQLAEFSGFEVDYGDDDENVIPLGITINFATYTMTAKKGMTGGKPFLIKTSKDISVIEADECSLVNAITDVTKTDEFDTSGKFTGTFTKTTVPADGLFLNSNKFYYSTGQSNIKAFRGWFELGAVLNRETDFGVKMVVDGFETKVEGLGVKDAAGNVYDLSGRKVSKAQRGVYIVNGKKVLVK